MAILGATLRAELAKALGLDALRKDLRVELRALARELRALRAHLQAASSRDSGGTKGGLGGGQAALSAESIRAARQRLGESRKAFAARVRVSPSIVFAWESGRSVPRRSAVVARLQRVVAQALNAPAPSSQASRTEKAPQAQKRVLKLSAKRRAALKLQGQYMGYLRSLGPRHTAKVKKLKATSGYPAALKLAAKLRRR
jgi:transcriptional regulator with XRE-family HTH domain